MDDVLLLHQTYTGLILCDEDTDSLFFNQGANESLRVSLRHDPSVGDLRLEVNSTDGNNALLATSDGPHGLEVIELGPTGGERTLRLTIGGRPGYTVEYSLSIEELGENMCPRDAYEGLLGNDDQAHAATVRDGEIFHRVCGDPDWFKIHLTAGEMVSVNAYPIDAVNALETALYDEAGQQVAVGAVDPNGFVVDGVIFGDWLLDYTVQHSGWYFIEVRSSRPDVTNNRNRLEITTEAAPNAGALICAEAIELQLGVPQMIQAPGSGTTLPISCGNDIGDTIVGLLNVPAPTTVSVSFAATLVSAGVSIRAPSCDDAQDDISCLFTDELGPDEPFVIRDVNVPGGQSYLILEANFVGLGTLLVQETAP